VQATTLWVAGSLPVPFNAPVHSRSGAPNPSSRPTWHPHPACNELHVRRPSPPPERDSWQHPCTAQRPLIEKNHINLDFVYFGEDRLLWRVVEWSLNAKTFSHLLLGTILFVGNANTMKWQVQPQKWASQNPHSCKLEFGKKKSKHAYTKLRVEGQNL
jgi:hypothetical protein